MATAIQTEHPRSLTASVVQSRWAIPLLLALAALVLYAHNVRYDMMWSWDDNRYIRENMLLRDGGLNGALNIFFQPTFPFLRFYFAAYIPVTLFSYWVEFQLWGLQPAGYHVVNVLLHAANAALVYLFLERLLGKRWVAILAAALFIVHPVQVESVSWIAERKNLLAFFFALLSFLAHMRSARPGAHPTALWATWLLFLLSGLSKPTVVGLPVLFILYDYYWARMPLTRAIKRNVVPMLVGAAVAVLIIVAHSDYGGIKEYRGGSILTTAGVMLIVFWDYVVALVAPIHLNNFYIYPAIIVQQYPGSLVLGGLLLAAMAWVAWQGLRRKRPFALFAVAWVVLFMAPVANIIPIAIERADRYMYFPTVVIFAAVGLGLEWLWRRWGGAAARYAIVGVSVAVVLVFAAVTFQHSEIWLNEGTLWTDHLRDYPASRTGWLNLGVYHYNRAEFAPATDAFTTLLGLEPNHFKGNRFMAHMALREDRFADAIPYYQRAASADPNDSITQNYMALSYFRLQDYPNAVAHYRRAIQLDPSLEAAYENLGMAALATGDNELARQALEVALERKPDDARLNSDFCTALANLNRNAEALDYCSRAAALEPSNGLYLGRQAHLLLMAGDAALALPVAEQAVQVAPENALSYRVLGDALAGLGRAEEAIPAYRLALELQPNNSRARAGLEALLNP